jgi:hypothetical protein
MDRTPKPRDHHDLMPPPANPAVSLGSSMSCGTVKQVPASESVADGNELNTAFREIG